MADRLCLIWTFFLTSTLLSGSVLADPEGHERTNRISETLNEFAQETNAEVKVKLMSQVATELGEARQSHQARFVVAVLLSSEREVGEAMVKALKEAYSKLEDRSRTERFLERLYEAILTFDTKIHVETIQDLQSLVVRFIQKEMVEDRLRYEISMTVSAQERITNRKILVNLTKIMAASAYHDPSQATLAQLEVVEKIVQELRAATPLILAQEALREGKRPVFFDVRTFSLNSAASVSTLNDLGRSIIHDPTMLDLYQQKLGQIHLRVRR